MKIEELMFTKVNLAPTMAEGHHATMVGDSLFRA
jgi:hypothetical protein